MLSITVKDNQVECEFKGSLLTIESDTCAALSSIYRSLAKRNEEHGREFKRVITTQVDNGHVFMSEQELKEEAEKALKEMLSHLAAAVGGVDLDAQDTAEPGKG